MDIISHGLWGGIAFGRKNKRLFWWSFVIGLAPDLLSFGLYSAADILGLVSGPDWKLGSVDPAAFPMLIYKLYNITHSLVIFAVVFGLIWLLRRKPFLPMLAWGLHILVDIPTHSTAFFPTPFLWPISSFTVNGISWGRPMIFYPDVILLVALYSVWWISKRRKKNNYG